MAVWDDIKLNDKQSSRRYRPSTQITEIQVERYEHGAKAVQR